MSKIYNGRNARSVIDSAINSVSDMRPLRPAFPAGGSALADVAAYLGNTPAAPSFATTAVGATSAAQTVTVAASLKSGNSISGLAIATTGDFARSGGTCGAAVGTGTSCTVLVTLTPTASGARSGSLNVSHSKTLTPIGIALSGTGGAAATAPVAAIAPLSVALAATPVGATSAAQNVTVSNTGTAALSLTAVSLDNLVDFAIAGGTCSAGTIVAAGSSCTVSLAFRPAAGAVGARSSTLSIAHNAAGGTTSVALSGNATAPAAPAAALTTSLVFGSVNVGTASPAQTATLSNNGTAALLIATLSTGSSEFPVSGGSCVTGGSVAAGAGCTVNLFFRPTAAGARSANLVVTHNAGGGQSSASLSGTGVALNPVIGVSPATLAFSQPVGTTSAAQTVSIGNSGNAPLLISALGLAGAQAVEFQIAAGSTCAAGATVPANGSCVVKLAFAPIAAGARSASLTVSHNAGAPSSVTLNGIGTATPQAAISLNATTLTFAAQTLGSASASQAVTVSNGGSAALVLGGLTLTGSAAVDFTPGGTCAVGATLAAGASCTVDFRFTPGAVGARSASLTLASNASNGNAVLSLTGTGAAVAAPMIGLAPGSLAFGNQTVGLASAVRTVTLSNSGSGALALSAITATSGFAVAHTCGASVMAGASCVLSVTFKPAAAGTGAGSLSVASNAPGSPHAVSLGGTGVAASPVLGWTQATAALAFGDVSVGAAPLPQSMVMVNRGPGAVTLQQLTLVGAQAADFSLGSGSSCALNIALAQDASCTITLSFQPGAVGARSASLQVASTGTNPPDVALAGNGTAMSQPAVNLLPVTLNFDVSGNATTGLAQTLTVQSTGNAVLRVMALRVMAGSFTIAAAATSGCAAAPFDLMPGQSCMLVVGWSSTAPGSETGSVEIDTSASAAPARVDIQAVRSVAAIEAPAMANVGAGGCSIGRADDLTDPTLWLLVLLGGCALLWRGRARHRPTAPAASSPCSSFPCPKERP
ncbi:MAG: choice-of-anchor D domain-containing protein [Caldimonas sp.]